MSDPLHINDVIRDIETLDRCRTHLRQAVPDWDGRSVLLRHIGSTYYGDVDCWCVMPPTPNPRDNFGFLVSYQRCSYPYNEGRVPATA